MSWLSHQVTLRGTGYEIRSINVEGIQDPVTNWSLFDDHSMLKCNTWLRNLFQYILSIFLDAARSANDKCKYRRDGQFLPATLMSAARLGSVGRETMHEIQVGLSQGSPASPLLLILSISAIFYWLEDRHLRLHLIYDTCNWNRATQWHVSTC